MTDPVAVAGAVLLSMCATLLAWPPEAAIRPSGSGPPRDLLGPWPAAVLAPHPDALPARLRVLAGLAAAAGAAALIEGGWPGRLGAAVLVGATVAVGLGRFESAQARRVREQRVLAIPEVLDLLAGCLRAGLPLRGAVAHVAAVSHGPARADLEAVLARVELGLDDPGAWSDLAKIPGWEAAARDIARAAGHGTSLVPVLDRHAEQARSTATGLRRQRARTAGVRSVFPLMVCFLPAFVLVGIVPAVASALLGLIDLG